MKCWKCGFDRAGLVAGSPCPECGARPPSDGNPEWVAHRTKFYTRVQVVFGIATIAAFGGLGVWWVVEWLWGLIYS